MHAVSTQLGGLEWTGGFKQLGVGFLFLGDFPATWPMHRRYFREGLPRGSLKISFFCLLVVLVLSIVYWLKVPRDIDAGVVFVSAPFHPIGRASPTGLIVLRGAYHALCFLVAAGGAFFVDLDFWGVWVWDIRLENGHFFVCERSAKMRKIPKER